MFFWEFFGRTFGPYSCFPVAFKCVCFLLKLPSVCWLLKVIDSLCRLNWASIGLQQPPKRSKTPTFQWQEVQYSTAFSMFFLGVTSLKHAIHAMPSKKSSRKKRRKNGTRSESQMGPAPSTSLSRPGLAGTQQRLALRLQRSGARGGYYRVVSVGKLRRLVNVWVYRGYPVQLLCRCEWEIIKDNFSSHVWWKRRMADQNLFDFSDKHGNIARNMSTSGIEVGNIGMTKHSTWQKFRTPVLINISDVGSRHGARHL